MRKTQMKSQEALFCIFVYLYVCNTSKKGQYSIIHHDIFYNTTTTKHKLQNIIQSQYKFKSN